MKEKIKNAWNWTKEHKTEIAATAVVLIGSAVLWKCHMHKKDILTGIVEVPELPTVELAKGVSDFDGTLLQVNDTYALSDLGKLGKQIREFAPSVPDEIYIWGLLDPTETET